MIESILMSGGQTVISPNLIMPETKISRDLTAHYFDFTNGEAVTDEATGLVYRTNALVTDVPDFGPGLRALDFANGGNFLVPMRQEFPGDFTLECIARTSDDVINAAQLIVGSVRNDFVSAAYGVSIGIVTSGKYYNPSYPGTSRESSTTAPRGAWIHLSVMRKNGVCYCFANGIPYQQFNMTNTIAKTTLGIGDHPGGTSRPFKGKLVMVAMSSTARYSVAGFLPEFPKW